MGQGCRDIFEKKKTYLNVLSFWLSKMSFKRINVLTMGDLKCITFLI